MKTALAILLLLLLAAFSLATDLTRRQADWAREEGTSPNLLTVVLGDSRRLFAKHIYSKADAYFHSGYYPSMFDGEETRKGSALAAASADQPAGHEQHAGQDEHAEHEHGHSAEEHEACDFLGQPKDWIDRFSRNFFPSEHRHLGEAVPGQGRPATGAGEEREILPWFRLAAELDPDRPETYVVAAYWLRSRLNRITEAEQFLREGLRANPAHPELLFELGRIYAENHHDPRRACNIWELALAKLEQGSAATSEADLLLHAQLLGNLAKLEEQQQNFPAALRHLEALKVISPNKQSLTQWMEDLQDLSDFGF